MLFRDRDKLNRIEELKTKLFSKDYQTKIEHRDSLTHFDKKDVPDEWGDGVKNSSDSYSFQDKFFMKTSVFKKFFIFSIAFFILALSYASYVFLVGGNTVSNNNIDISVLGNNFTAGGEELSLIVGVTNRNSSSLDLVDLVAEYPKNSSTGSEADATSPTERLRVSLGTIPSGVVRNENIKMILFGQQGSIIPIKISIEYRVEGSNAIFVKEKNHEVTINSTPLNLSVDAPLSISANQDITLAVKATLNATRTTPQVLLKLDYPVGFQFKSATPAPTLGNNVWSLGDLAPGAERNISIVGKMIDAFDGEEKTFYISGGSQSKKDKSAIDVVLNSISHTIAIQKSFIEAKLFINGVHQSEYATDSQTTIHGDIEWMNNLDTKINDLEIRAKISGNAFNRNTINAEQGFYNSSQDVIVWDKNSVNSFKEVNPGDSGSVKFSVSPLAVFSTTSGLLPSPSFRVEISISGKDSGGNYQTTELTNYDSGNIRIISDVGFATKALYYTGAFVNSGLIPPKVEQPTTYTVVWSLSNTANNVSKAVVTSSLPPWVDFVGTISPTDEDLTFNSSTRDIVWRAGSVPKGTGINSSVRTVSFQISFSPSLSQVGTIPVLVNGAVLTGHDDFANVDLRVSKTSLSTQLDNDPLFTSGGGKVTQ